MNGALFIQHNLIWIATLVIVDLILRGVALWRSAKKNQLYWFIALIIFNTLGVLPVIYLLFFQKKIKTQK